MNCTKEIVTSLMTYFRDSTDEFRELVSTWAEHYQSQGWSCKNSLQFTRERVKYILQVGRTTNEY